MGSHTKDEVYFGERYRTLRFDIAAMIDLEAAMGGKSTGEIVASLAAWNFTALVLALWAGLKHEDRKLKATSVQTMLERYVSQDGANLRQLRDTVRECIQASTWYRQAISNEDEDEQPEADPGNA